MDVLLCGSTEQAQFDSSDSSLCPVGDTELSEDVLDMDFDRTHTDRQLLGDLRVGLPLDEQAQHLVFTFGELLREQFLSRGRFTVQVSKQADHDFTVQERFSPQDAPNGGNKFGLPDPPS